MDLEAKDIATALVYVLWFYLNKNQSRLEEDIHSLKETDEEIKKQYISDVYLEKALKAIETQMKSNQDLILEKINSINDNTKRIENRISSYSKRNHDL